MSRGMKYYKIVDGNYILAIARAMSSIGVEISREEYEKIRTVLKDKPFGDGIAVYRLRNDKLVWEQIDIKEHSHSEQAM